MGVTDNQIFHIFVACIIPFIGGFIGNFWHYDGTFIGTIVKPHINGVYGPLWIIIYAATGYASYRVWRTGSGAAKIALIVYVVQLILSWSWPPVLYLFNTIAQLHFFVWLAFAILTAILFYQIDNIAGFIFIPYVVWIIIVHFFK